MDGGAGPRSLFLVLDYAYMDPQYFSIRQLETRQEIKKTIVDQKEDIICFNQRCPSTIKWLCCSTDTEDLYLVPNWGFGIPSLPSVKPLHGYKLNMRTRSCEPIPPPLSSRMHGHVVNVKGRIYFLASHWHYKKEYNFQCYDPDTKLWDPLEPLPALLGDIVGTAVWCNTILFNVASRSIWGYDVIGKKWYPVKFEDSRRYGFIGEAVVVGDTIYALTADRSSFRILVLTIKKKGSDRDLVFECSLCSDHYVLGIKLIYEWDESVWERTRQLVNLGEDMFCLVQSCLYPTDECYQPIQLSYIKLEGGKWRVLRQFIHKVMIIQGPGMDSDQFRVVRGFSLPKGATSVLEEGKILNVKPYPEEEEYASNPVQEEEILTPLNKWKNHGEIFPSKTTTVVDTMEDQEMFVSQPPCPRCPVRELYKMNASNPVQKEEIVTPVPEDGLRATSEPFQDNDSSQKSLIDEQEGHSVYIANLPPTVTIQQLEKGLKKFGPIKRVGIQLDKSKKEKCFAIVEFESAISQLRATEASTTMIGKRLFGITLHSEAPML